MENYVVFLLALVLFVVAYIAAWFNGPEQWRRKLMWIGALSVVIACTAVLAMLTPDGLCPFGGRLS